MPNRLAVPLLLALALPASAAEQVLTLESDAAQVTFFLKATGHDVNGTFDLRTCSVRFDPEKGTASGQIAFDAPSATTFNAKRDKTMHGKVLKSDVNPLITFVPERFEGTLQDGAASDVVLHGTVTLLGRDHPLSLPATVEPMGEKLHLKSTFPVPYIDWGLKNPSLMFLRVAKVVDVTVEGDARLQSVETASMAMGH